MYKCPHCNDELQPDKSNPEKLLCYSCRKRYDTTKIKEYWDEQDDNSNEDPLPDFPGEPNSTPENPIDDELDLFSSAAENMKPAVDSLSSFDDLEDFESSIEQTRLRPKPAGTVQPNEFPPPPQFQRPDWQPNVGNQESAWQGNSDGEASSRINIFAIISLALGVAAAIIAFFPIVGMASIIIGVAAIVCGIIGLKKGMKSIDKGCSIGGIVLGAVGAVIAIVLFALHPGMPAQGNAGQPDSNPGNNTNTTEQGAVSSPEQADNSAEYAVSNNGQSSNTNTASNSNDGANSINSSTGGASYGGAEAERGNDATPLDLSIPNLDYDFSETTDTKLPISDNWVTLEFSLDQRRYRLWGTTLRQIIQESNYFIEDESGQLVQELRPDLLIPQDKTQRILRLFATPEANATNAAYILEIGIRPPRNEPTPAMDCVLDHIRLSRTSNTSGEAIPQLVFPQGIRLTSSKNDLMAAYGQIDDGIDYSNGTETYKFTASNTGAFIQCSSTDFGQSLYSMELVAKTPVLWNNKMPLGNGKFRNVSTDGMNMDNSNANAATGDSSNAESPTD